MNLKKRVNVLPVSVLIVLCFSLIGNAASPLPSAHNISGVTQHKQINALGCGPAALEIMFDFWGADIKQKSIADVARSSSIGTYTWDMVRSGHFSHLSEAKGSFFPHDVLTAGFTERPVGYASFSYSSNEFWGSELKALIASDIPVILLMKYAPNDDTGHYRVIVGYDDIKNEVYFMDPWDRDFGKVTNPDGTVTWKMSDFKEAWNYSRYGTSHPYWGAVMIPWSVNIVTSGKSTADSVVRVTAEIKYPCPRPFDCSAYPASNTSAEIVFPSNMNVSGSSRIDIGNLAAGKSTAVSWNVKVGTDAAGSVVTVSAEGEVSGTVPKVYWNGNNVSYPAYNYTDKIGGNASVRL